MMGGVMLLHGIQIMPRQGIIMAATKGAAMVKLSAEETLARLIEAQDRFWSKVDRRGPDDCWPWLAKARTKFGYGRFAVPRAGRQLDAHKVAYLLTHGFIPAGLMVLHRCDNPPCCNPAHLRAGTSLDNMRDRAERGRLGDARRFGESNGRSRVTAEQVRDLRARDLSIKQIMAEFGVSRAQAWRLRSGKHWPEV
jgi:hypothetical protein